jgi:hypothetical protein
VTATLSVDAFQARVTLVAATAVARRFAGVVGGWVSSLRGVVTSTLLLAPDGLPAPSRASTDST